jgi:hypothetical protein
VSTTSDHWQDLGTVAIRTKNRAAGQQLRTITRNDTNQKNAKVPRMELTALANHMAAASRVPSKKFNAGS